MKYKSFLKKRERYGIDNVCEVEIDCDDWQLYERLTKIVEKELEK